MFPSRGEFRPEELFAGRYAVDGALPWGGLVTYYRASTEGTPLILTVLPMDLSHSLRAEAAFSQLAQALGGTRSHALPRVLDAGVIDGIPYLAFADTRGTLLSDLLASRPLGSLDVLRLASDVLDGLEAGHGRGLVHGDLTPRNIVVARDRRGKLTAKVIGIGTRPLLRNHPEASAHAARAGSGEHTVSYMAPELIGSGAFDPSADIYSVGTLLHHMVTGAPPVGWENGEGFDDIPGLPDVIDRAMAKHPTHRYPTAAAMRTALEWLEVESMKQNPRTQDIAPWMETSHIGSIPVPSLNSTHPPAHASSSHPVGKILSTSGARPIPVEPTIVEEVDSRVSRLRQVVLILTLLGILALSFQWSRTQGAASPTPVDLELQRGALDGR